MKIILKIYEHIRDYGVRSFKIYSFYKLRTFFTKPFLGIKTSIRVIKLKKPDKFLGTYNVDIEYENRNILKKRFELKTQLFFDNKYSLENYRDFHSKINLKLLVFSPIFIGNSEKYIKNELTFNVMSSAENAGWNVKQYYGKSQQNASKLVKEREIDEFMRIIEEFKPQLVCIDSNSAINYNNFNNERLSKIKKKYSFKVLMFVPDFEIRKLQYWGNDLVDFVNFSRPSLRSKINFIPEQKLICLPGIPYFESIFEGLSEKKYDFFYSGSDARQRRIFLDGARNTNLYVKALFENRINLESPDYKEYCQEIGKSRMTFANGYISRNNSLIAGRFIESILSKSVCLYEDCPDLDAFFLPYRHYIPVSNIHEFVITAQFLRINPEILVRISEEAYTYYMQNYSSKLFWNYIASRMNV